MKYEDHIFLEYILQARTPVAARDVLKHLANTVEGFEVRQGADGGLRKIQQRLKALAECDDFSRLIEVVSDGKSNRYKGIRSPGGREPTMGIEQACSLLMSDKHLSALAPTRLFQSQNEYQDLIARAQTALSKHEKTRLRLGENMGDFVKRVTVLQRGQNLVAAPIQDGVLECIASCIVKRRCINFTYNNEQRVLHPFGLVFRQPKIYLLAVDTKSLKKQGASKVRPRQWLCNRMSNVSVSKQQHQVPHDFDINVYVEKGRLDMRAFDCSSEESRSFTLKLRIHGQADNLIRDLKEHPLSEHQQILPDTENDAHILTASGMRATHSLVEWVMGRMERVEVILPLRLRKHVMEKVDAMHSLYRV